MRCKQMAFQNQVRFLILFIPSCSSCLCVSLLLPGSPTIRVDGRDIDPAGASARPALNCRIYHLPDGRVSPVPTREQLEEALR